MHPVPGRLVPQVSGADVDPVEPVVGAQHPVADRRREGRGPPRRLKQRALEPAGDLRLERGLRAGARAGPGPLRADVDQPQRHPPVVVQVGDADLAAERPRLQERHAGERAGVAVERVAAEHEVDAAGQPLAERPHPPGRSAGVDAVVQRQHDVPRARVAQLGGQLDRHPGRVGVGRRAGVHLRHGGQREADHPDLGQHPRGREAQRQVAGQQRERELGAPAP